VDQIKEAAARGESGCAYHRLANPTTTAAHSGKRVSNWNTSPTLAIVVAKPTEALGDVGNYCNCLQSASQRAAAASPRVAAA